MFNNISSGLIQDYVREFPDKRLPYDVWALILPKLEFSDLNVMTRLSKDWNNSLQPLLNQLWIQAKNAMIFDRNKWLNIPGVFDVSDDEPSLPDNIDERLKETCLFFNEKDDVQPHRFEDGKIKRVWQTRILLTIPATVNGLPHNAGNFGRLMRFLNKNGGETMFEGDLLGEEGGQSTSRSYRILVTLDLVPRSRCQMLEVKKNLLEDKDNRMLWPLEAITAFAIMNLGPSQEGKGYFFGREGKYWTYTAMERSYCFFGAASSSGFIVSRYYNEQTLVGLAGAEDVCDYMQLED